MRISEQQIKDYQRDGVVVIRKLIDEKDLQLLARGVRENLDNPTHRSVEYVKDPVTNAHFFHDACIFGQFDSYDRVMIDSPMAQVAAGLMNSSMAVLFYLTVFVRSPGTLNRSPWHQDQRYWSVAGDQVCSIWTPLDPVPKDTALEFVRGSHRWETQFERPDFFDSRVEKDSGLTLSQFPDIESERDKYDIVSWALDPGDSLVFHGMTIHGGSGNLPAQLGRRAVSVQWLGEDARFRDVDGSDEPDISLDLIKHAIRPGDPLVCDMCPIVWSSHTD